MRSLSRALLVATIAASALTSSVSAYSLRSLRPSNASDDALMTRSNHEEERPRATQLLGAAASVSAVLLRLSATSTITTVTTPIQGRVMWGWGPNVPGYCGEASIQTAALYFGNWISQEQVYRAAGSKEVLIGLNAAQAATKLKFKVESFTGSTTSYLAWIQKKVTAKAAVIGTWYTKITGGDSDYDHIMPIQGYTTSSTGTIASLYYYDLYSTAVRTSVVPTDVLLRSQCTMTNPVQPYTYCVPKSTSRVKNYGMAILGIADPYSRTFRVQLSVGSSTEPDWGSVDGVNAAPVQFTPSATISGLTVGVAYVLLRFDSYNALPATRSSNFLTAAWSVKVPFTATTTTVTLTGLAPISSSGMYFYRAVRA